MTDKKIDADQLQKSLDALKETLVKGHNSRGTNTTQVETMRDASVGTGSSAGATQVYHAPNNSLPESHAGTKNSRVPDDGAYDDIEENGTDYNGKAKLIKSIMDKLAKGVSLTAEEFALVKAGLFEKKDEKEDKGKDVDPEEMDKSLEDLAEEDEDTKKGLEVSEFLDGFVRTVSKSLDNLEARLKKHVDSRIASLSGEQGAVSKSLTDVMGSMAQVVQLVNQRVDQLEMAPAGAPRAAQGVQAIEKGLPQGNTLSKAVILSRMEDLVMKGQLSAQAVLKYEHTGEIDAPTKQLVLNHA